jgi:hypothetical protein
MGANKLEEYAKDPNSKDPNEKVKKTKGKKKTKTKEPVNALKK